MSVTPWFRTYNRMVDDEKLRLLAFEDRWHFMALCCLKNEGLLDERDCELRRRKIAVRMGVQVRELEEIGRRLMEVGLIDKHLNPLKWDELQRPSDTSSERVKKFREKQRDSRTKRDETVTETECNGYSNGLEEEVESELSPSGDCPSGDEPAVRPEHVFEAYQDMARELGLTVPRDLTPERRQLIRGRISQYPFEDFLTVFARCRGSPFLRGDRSGRTPLSVDWLMKKSNFQKTLEGNYD